MFGRKKASNKMSDVKATDVATDSTSSKKSCCKGKKTSTTKACK